MSMDSGAPPPTDEDFLGFDDGEPCWRDDLVTTTSGMVKPCLSNAITYLRHHPHLAGLLATDSRTRRLTWLGPRPWSGTRGFVREADAGELALWLARYTGVAFTASVIFEAITTEAATSSFDPVKHWISGLEWDGKPRVDDWLVQHVRAEDSEYTRAVGVAWMISAVARTMRPGCQADYVLVLEGKQGTRKSSTIEVLAGKDWYADISISGLKDSVLAIHGPWICEWSELSGMARSEVELVKSFVSRRVDHVRLPYGRFTQDLPRRCIFAGTTNDSNWHSDPTGARRFWPIKTTGCDVAGLAAVREQLWAEALYRYKAGEKWYLGSNVEIVAAEVQEDRYEGDAWEGQIIDALDYGSFQGRDRVTLSDMMEVLSLPSSAQNTGTGKRVSRIMVRLGWEKIRWWQDRRYLRGYKRPEYQGYTEAQVDETEQK